MSCLGVHTLAFSLSGLWQLISPEFNNVDPPEIYCHLPCCRYSFGVMMWELCHGMLAWHQVCGGVT